MAAGPVAILPFDLEPRARDGWQLAKTLSTAQTAVTAAKLSQNLQDVSFAQDNVKFVDVSAFKCVRIQLWGVGSDNNAPVIDLYGWDQKGPGAHIGQVTTAMGNFESVVDTGFHASSLAHKSVRQAFAKGTAYRGFDTYTITSDNEQQVFSSVDSAAVTLSVESFKSLESPSSLASSSTSPVQADFPSFLEVNLIRSCYHYLGILVTNLGSATTVGAIIKGTQLR